MNFFKRPLFYSSILFALALSLFQTLSPPTASREDSVHHLATPGKEKIFIGGEIVSEVEKRPSLYGGSHSAFILKAARAWADFGDEGRPVTGKIRVVTDSPNEDLLYGDQIVLQGDLDLFPPLRNPGGFDARRYWMRQGVVAVLFVKKNAPTKVLRHDQGHPAKAAAIRFKQKLSSVLTRDFEPQKAAFLKALFLGERSSLDEATKDLFMRTGTMHLLAVSGFNLGFLFAVSWLLLKPFPIARDPKLLIILLALWSYTALVGWQPPVIRAAVMATALIVARLIGRKADTLNLLGLAAFVILLFRPADVLDIGFQLSFFAVWGMAVFTPVFISTPVYLPHEKPTLPEKCWQGVKELFWISFICLFVTLPITVQNFYIVTPWSLLTNILVVPLSFLIFFAGALYFMTLPLIPGDWLVVQVIRALIQVFIRILELFESAPGAVVIVGKLHVLLWGLLIAGLFYLFFSKRFRSPIRRAIGIVLFTVVIFLSQEALRLYRPHLSIFLLDVGQGDAIYIELPNKGSWLVDGGTSNPDQGRRVITPFLRSRGIRRLDAVVVSHPQQDHIGGLLSVIEEFRVEQIFHNGRAYPSALFQQFQRSAQDKKIPSKAVAAGDFLKQSDIVAIHVLHPPKDIAASANVNEDSLVLRLDHGQNSVLLTGDIEDKGLEQLLHAGHLLEADILKFPHHGAKVGPEGLALMERCRPEWVLMSLGAKNPFGHPHPSALAVLQPIPQDRVLRTDQEGAVQLRSDGRRIWRA